MPAHQGAWRHARMKRSGAELPLCTWSACGGRLNGVAVATVKRGGGGDAPHCVLSRCASRRVACQHVVQVCGLLNVVCMSFGRVVDCGRAKCAQSAQKAEEGDRRRRRPWKPNTLSLLINKNACCCCVVLEAAIHRPQFQSARPPLSTTPYGHASPRSLCRPIA